MQIGQIYKYDKSYQRNAPFVSLTDEERLFHLHVLGKTGMGKSTYLLSQLAQDILSGAVRNVTDTSLRMHIPFGTMEKAPQVSKTAHARLMRENRARYALPDRPASQPNRRAERTAQPADDDVDMRPTQKA